MDDIVGFFQDILSGSQKKPMKIGLCQFGINVSTDNNSQTQPKQPSKERRLSDLMRGV